MSRAGASRTLRNVGYNLFGALVPVLVTLFTVPVYLHIVGPGRYGVILVAWSLLGYFGFMDLGISRATTHALAKLANDEAAGAKARVFWSSLIVNGALGLLGGLVMWALGSFLIGHVLTIDPAIHRESVGAVPWIAAMLPVALMLGVGVGASEAHDRFGLLNLLQSAGLILGQALPLLVVTVWGPSLLIIMPVMFAVRLATFVAVMLLAMRVSGVGVRPIVDLRLVRELMSYGGWVTVTNVVSPLMTSADQFVIGALRTVSVIPFYAVPLNIVSRTLMVPATLTRTLFPTISRMAPGEGGALVAKALMHLSTVMTLIYIAGILLGGEFLRLWLGAEMAVQGASVLQLLCAGAWANSIGYVLFTALQGQGKPRTVATIHSAEVLPYLAALYVLVRAYGIYGAAVAWAARVAVDAVALAVVLKVDRRCLRALMPGVVALAAALTIARLLKPGPLPAVAATAVLAGLFLGASVIVNDATGELLRTFRARRHAVA